jgi:hypothetical protein
LKRPDYDSQEMCAFVGGVHGKAPPVAAIPQIGEETGAILMKMQKSPASDIKYSRPPLYELSARPEAGQQIAQRV